MNESFSNVKTFFDAVLRRKFTCLVISIVITTGIIGLSYLIPPQYKADSTVFIEENIIKDLVEGLAVATEIEDNVRVLKYAMLSRNLIYKVLKKMDPSLLPIDKEGEVPEEFIAKLQKETRISVRGKDLFQVSFVDSSPRFAQEFINTLVDTYIQENTSTQREETYGANRFFKEQIDLFRKKLDEAEDAIIALRNKQGTYLSIDEKSLLTDLKRLTVESEQLDFDLNTLRAKEMALKKQLESVEEQIPLTSGTEQSGKSELEAMEKRLNLLLTKYTENYPEVVRLQAEIAEKQKELASGKPDEEEAKEMVAINPLFIELKQQHFALLAEISSIESKNAMLTRLIKQREAELQDVPESRKMLNMLEQERDSAKKIYQDLLSRMAQAEVSKQMEIGDKTTTFRVIDPAIFPVKPFSPNMMAMIAAGVVVGIGVSLGMVFLLEGFNTTVRRSKDLLAYGLPVLSEMPMISDETAVKRDKAKTMLAFLIFVAYYAGVLALLLAEALEII